MSAPPSPGTPPASAATLGEILDRYKENMTSADYVSAWNAIGEKRKREAERRAYVVRVIQTRYVCCTTPNKALMITQRPDYATLFLNDEELAQIKDTISRAGVYRDGCDGKLPPECHVSIHTTAHRIHAAPIQSAIHYSDAPIVLRVFETHDEFEAFRAAQVVLEAPVQTPSS